MGKYRISVNYKNEFDEWVKGITEYPRTWKRATIERRIKERFGKDAYPCNLDVDMAVWA